jgi:pimeloyl-ACP methyl ester carboxylesterase
VLLPGLDGTGRLFAPLLAALPESVAGLVVSYPVDEPLGYDELLAIVRDALPKRGPYLLVAESFSGPIAVRLAAERPPGLAGLVLAASFVRSPIGSWGPLNVLIGAASRVRPPRWAIRRYLVGRDASDELTSLASAAIASVDRRVTARRVREVLRIDVTAELASTSIPILYLVGEDDRLVGRRALRRLQGLRPELQVVSLEAPHLVLQRRPDQAAEALVEFVEEHLPPGDYSAGGVGVPARA